MDCEMIAAFHERAGIIEFEGGLPPGRADRQALVELVDAWCRENPGASIVPEVCAHCHAPEDQDNGGILRCFTQTLGGVWLHNRCAAVHGRARRVAAILTLLRAGLEIAPLTDADRESMRRELTEAVAPTPLSEAA